MNRAPILLSLSLTLIAVPATYAGAQTRPVHSERVAAHRRVTALPFQVHILPTTLPAGDTSIEAGDTSWAARGYDLRTLIAQIFDIDVRRVDFPDQSIADQRFDVSVDLPSTADENAVHEVLATAVEKRFGIQISRETKPMDVYVLTAPNGGGTALHRHAAADEEGGSITFFGKNCTDSGSLTGIAVADSTIADFRRTLEPELDRVLVDETNLKGSYDFTVGNYANQKELFQRLRDQLGLVITSTQRNVTVLTVKRDGGSSQTMQASL
ncbi:MAG TPA: TIGR03435 family protein [Acidobacteriaceae bacterium]|nr:TIGR03435 family protein [Acidobacteriaceae bacterium]